MLRLAVIGHIEWVTFANAPFVPGPGEIVHLSDPLSQPGGGGAVTAVALRRMGAQVTFYTTLGSDERAREPLERHGVRLEAIVRAEPQTEVLALVDPAGERTLYVVGDNDAPTAADLLPWDELAGMDGCYFTGYDPATLGLARQTRVLVVTARRFEALVASGVRADALVGSGRDRGEQYDLSRARDRDRRPSRLHGLRGRPGAGPGCRYLRRRRHVRGRGALWARVRVAARSHPRGRGGARRRGAGLAGRVAPADVIRAC